MSLGVSRLLWAARGHAHDDGLLPSPVPGRPRQPVADPMENPARPARGNVQIRGPICGRKWTSEKHIRSEYSSALTPIESSGQFQLLEIAEAHGFVFFACRHDVAGFVRGRRKKLLPRGYANCTASVVQALPWRICPIVLPSTPWIRMHHQMPGLNT